jgi:aspartate oxidase
MYRIEYEKLGIVQSQVVMFATGGYVQVYKYSMQLLMSVYRERFNHIF